MTAHRDQPPTKTEIALLGVLGLAGFLGLWWGVSLSGLVPRQFLPTPLEVLDRTMFLMNHPFAGATLPVHLARSFERYAYGFLLAAAIGVPLGLLMGWFQWLDAMVRPVFDSLRLSADCLGAIRRAVVRNMARRSHHDHLLGRFPPVRDQHVSRRQVRRAALCRGGEDVGVGTCAPSCRCCCPPRYLRWWLGLRIAAGLGWQSLVGAS